MIVIVAHAARSSLILLSAPGTAAVLCLSQHNEQREACREGEIIPTDRQRERGERATESDALCETCTYKHTHTHLCVGEEAEKPNIKKNCWGQQERRGYAAIKDNHREDICEKQRLSLIKRPGWKQRFLFKQQAGRSETADDSGKRKD